MKKTVAELLRDSANLFDSRNAMYGDGYNRTGKILKAFFPNGIHLNTEEDFSRFFTFGMLLVKLDRYARNFCKGGHLDSIRDAQVYAAMLEYKDQK